MSSAHVHERLALIAAAAQAAELERAQVEAFHLAIAEILAPYLIGPRAAWFRETEAARVALERENLQRFNKL